VIKMAKVRGVGGERLRQIGGRQLGRASYEVEGKKMERCVRRRRALGRVRVRGIGAVVLV